MFSKNSVDAAQALAQLAASQGKTFVPQSDTPLGELVKTSYLFDIPVITEGVALEGVAEQMSLSASEMLSVNGVGTRKLERFGKEFMALIRSHADGDDEE